MCLAPAAVHVGPALGHGSPYGYNLQTANRTAIMTYGRPYEQSLNALHRISLELTHVAWLHLAVSSSMAAHRNSVASAKAFPGPCLHLAIRVSHRTGLKAFRATKHVEAFFRVFPKTAVLQAAGAATSAAHRNGCWHRAPFLSCCVK